MKKANNPWQTLSSRVVYKNPYIELVEEKVIKPNGKKGIYGFVKARKTVGIVAVDDNMNFYLCKQFRYIFKDQTLEIPRGFVENGETPTRAAIRELKEEANLSAKKLERIGSLRLSAGLLDEEAEVFLAKNVRPTMDTFTDTEREIKEVLKFTLKEMLSMINKGEIKDGLTVGSILLYSTHLDSTTEK